MKSNRLPIVARFFDAWQRNNVEEMLVILKKDRDIASKHFAGINHGAIEIAILQLVKKYRGDYYSDQNQAAMKIVVVLLNHRETMQHLSLYHLLNIRAALSTFVTMLEYKTSVLTTPLQDECSQMTVNHTLNVLEINISQAIASLGQDLEKLALTCEQVLADYLNGEDYTFLYDFVDICIEKNVPVHMLSLEQKISLLPIIHKRADESASSSVSSTKIFDSLKHLCDFCLTEMRQKTPNECKLSTLSVTTLSSYVTDVLASHYKVDTAWSPRQLIGEYLYSSMHDLFKDQYPDCCVALHKLKNNKKNFYDKLTLLDVLLELQELLSEPSTLNQGDRNLCGIASFCLQLLKDEPPLFMTMAIDLFCDGKTTIPISLTATPELVNNSQSLSDFILQTLRHNLNFFLSYNSEAKFEGVRGCTRPWEVVAMLQAAGYGNIRETTLVHTLENTEIALPFRALLGGVYSNYHYCFKTRNDNLDFVMSEMEANKSDSVIFLLRMPLVKAIKKGLPIDDTKRSTISFFVPIEFTHFMNVNSLSVDSNGLIHIDISTYGEKFSRSVKREDFAKYFDGAIIATSPSTMRSLSINLRHL